MQHDKYCSLKRTQQQKSDEYKTCMDKAVNDMKHLDNEITILKSDEKRELNSLNLIDYEMIDLQQEFQKRKQRKYCYDVGSIQQIKIKIIRYSMQAEKDLNYDILLLGRIESALDSLNEDDNQFVDMLQLEKMSLLQHVNTQIKRQKEIELLDESEVKTMWSQNKIQWKMITDAREKVLNEALESVKNYLQQKLQGNLEKQKKIIKLKEKVFKEYDENNKEFIKMVNDLTNTEDTLLEMESKNDLLLEEEKVLNKNRESLGSPLEFSAPDGAAHVYYDKYMPTPKITSNQENLDTGDNEKIHEIEMRDGRYNF